MNDSFFKGGLRGVLRVPITGSFCLKRRRLVVLQPPENHDPKFFRQCWQSVLFSNANRDGPSGGSDWRRSSSSSSTQHCCEEHSLPCCAHGAGLVGVAGSSWRRPVEPKLDGRPGCSIWCSTHGPRNVGQACKVCTLQVQGI